MNSAAGLITDAAHFRVGTLARNAAGVPCGLGAGSGAVQFDCLGALLAAYPDSSARQPIAKRVFDLCKARFDHKRLGKLDHQEALELLRDSNA